MAVDIRVSVGDIASWQDEAVVVNLFEGVGQPGGATGAVDAASGGLVASLLADGGFSGTFKDIAVLPSLGRIPARRIAVVGLGPREDFTLDRVREVSAVAAQTARDRGWRSFGTIVHGAGIGGLDLEDAARAVAEGAWLGLYRYEAFKTKRKEDSLERMTILTREKTDVPVIEGALRLARAACEATNFARDLVNAPSNEKTPAKLAAVAQELAKGSGLKCTVLGEDEAREMGMGAFLGVAKGSVEPAKFLVLEWPGNGGKPFVLAGKGITFDTGGISLKPQRGPLGPMWEMKHDMAGAAAVLATLKAAADLKLPLPLVGLAPCTENMPGGRAQKPGDVVTALDGQTIEVENTDAEGRLVLADALAFARRYKPRAIIDVATLTGAAVIGLGKKCAAVLGTDPDLVARIKDAAEATGDRVWELPLLEEYEEQIKSDVADVKNSGGRPAGPITAALFLKRFAGKVPWAHLDIAGPVWTDGRAASLQKAYLPKGATGYGVRLLVELVRTWAKDP
jgi:leucyl aminopeptidase